jgi:hypothetical protein
VYFVAFAQSQFFGALAITPLNGVTMVQLALSFSWSKKLFASPYYVVYLYEISDRCPTKCIVHLYKKGIYFAVLLMHQIARSAINSKKEHKSLF